MRDQQQMMIDRQAELISDLRKQLQSRDKRIVELELELSRMDTPAKFYLDMQKQIKENPTLLSEWQRFCTFLKIGADQKYLEKYVEMGNDDEEIIYYSSSNGPVA